MELKELKDKVKEIQSELKEKEINSILEPLKSGWLVQGPKVKKFEQKWSNFTKSKFSIAVTSCTSGLHLSLAALGIASEDEVIVPAFTWISTANVVEHVGAKVVFCDIDINTFNIDCEEAADNHTQDRSKRANPGPADKENPQD